MIILGCEMGGNPPFKETPIDGAFTNIWLIFYGKWGGEMDTKNPCSLRTPAKKRPYDQGKFAIGFP